MTDNTSNVHVCVADNPPVREGHRPCVVRGRLYLYAVEYFFDTDCADGVLVRTSTAPPTAISYDALVRKLRGLEAQRRALETQALADVTSAVTAEPNAPAAATSTVTAEPNAPAAAPSAITAKPDVTVAATSAIAAKPDVSVVAKTSDTAKLNEPAAAASEIIVKSNGLAVATSEISADTNEPVAAVATKVAGAKTANPVNKEDTDAPTTATSSSNARVDASAAASAGVDSGTESDSAPVPHADVAPPPEDVKGVGRTGPPQPLQSGPANAGADTTAPTTTPPAPSSTVDAAPVTDSTGSNHAGVDTSLMTGHGTASVTSRDLTNSTGDSADDADATTTDATGDPPTTAITVVRTEEKPRRRGSRSKDPRGGKHAVPPRRPSAGVANAVGVVTEGVFHNGPCCDHCTFPFDFECSGLEGFLKMPLCTPPVERSGSHLCVMCSVDASGYVNRTGPTACHLQQCCVNVDFIKIFYEHARVSGSL